MQNPMGKNNFDKLEAANLLSSSMPDPEQVKARLEARIQKLESIEKHLQATRLNMAKVSMVTKNQQMKLLGMAIQATTKFYEGKEFKLPPGSKKPLEACLNELTSLREGVYVSAKISKRTLALVTCKASEKEINTLILTAKERLIKLEADSADMQKLYDQAEAVIKKNKNEIDKLKSIATKPFVLARVPVVPVVDGISIPKLQSQGFAVDNLAGYPSIDKQLVIGINPKQFGENPGSVKHAAMKKMIIDEARRIIKALEKDLKTKLYFVSDSAFTKLSGTWYWVMPENDMKRFSKAFPNKKAIKTWGFSFD